VTAVGLTKEDLKKLMITYLHAVSLNRKMPITPGESFSPQTHKPGGMEEHPTVNKQKLHQFLGEGCGHRITDSRGWKGPLWVI